MGENVRTSYRIHVHGLTAVEFHVVCDELSLEEKTLEDSDGRPFKIAELRIPHTDLEVTYYTRDLT